LLFSQILFFPHQINKNSKTDYDCNNSHLLDCAKKVDIYPMELTDFVTRFASCFSQTESAKINANTAYRALDEWNSMLALIIIAMVDTDYKKELTADDIRQSNTINDLFDRLNEK